MEGKMKPKMEGIVNALLTLKIRTKFETNWLQLYIKEQASTFVVISVPDITAEPTFGYPFRYKRTIGTTWPFSLDSRNNMERYIVLLPSLQAAMSAVVLTNEVGSHCIVLCYVFKLRSSFKQLFTTRRRAQMYCIADVSKTVTIL